MVILTARTTVGREKTAIESVVLKNKDGKIKAILSPAELKGYIFVEGDDADTIREALKNVPHVRGVIDRPVDVEKLDKFFATKIAEIVFKEGDTVEVVGGPFKREKARIVRINEQKREAKIELLESAVPIPITIKLDLLKKITE